MGLSLKSVQSLREAARPRPPLLAIGGANRICLPLTTCRFWNTRHSSFLIEVSSFEATLSTLESEAESESELDDELEIGTLLGAGFFLTATGLGICLG